ncbi:DUF1810 domain-containing protein [Malikia spinosa]|jgi:uncharacterized protein (DUF1810 family)|uniref:DUF1810 domain-containing protein n=1 Tax=Malikia spinosa TaxID=86180 RepID=UPI003FA1FB7E
MDAQPDLARFLAAQSPVIDRVLAELHAGRKESHWMLFVFPQLGVLGRSGTARFYGIEDLEHARRYLAHPVLGPRLLECTRAVLAHGDRSAHAIFGSPDDLKFRSCMTLFDLAGPQQPEFRRALERLYAGEPDPVTVGLLA